MADFQRFRNAPENVVKMLQIQYKKLWDAYTTLLLKDPGYSTRIEALLRIASYILPGRFFASKELGELLYSVSNLLALLHDYIFRQNLKLPKYSGADDDNKLLMYLSVIESIEVFLEMGGERLWGEIGKWLVVVAIQLIKVGLRLLLLYKDKPKLQKYPLIPLLNRDLVFRAAWDRKVVEKTNEQNEETREENEIQSEEVQRHVWQCKRTGRYIRSLAASPPDGFRSWKLPEANNGDETVSDLTRRQFYAELLYILRPLLHLPSMFVFGEVSWKPWVFACAADVASLALHSKSNERLTTAEKNEISRRIVLMLFYFLRSPFYDHMTKMKIMTVLGTLSRNVPFLALVIQPLLEYLPSWQKTYFYNWCS